MQLEGFAVYQDMGRAEDAFRMIGVVDDGEDTDIVDTAVSAVVGLPYRKHRVIVSFGRGRQGCLAGHDSRGGPAGPC